MATKWWQLNAGQLSDKLKVDLSLGLNSDDVQRRLAEFGANQLKEKKQISPLALFLEQFNDFMIWVLLAAALISGFLKEWVDALAIIAIVILNAILGFIQEFRAEKSLAALKKLSAPNSRVIRDGQHAVVSSHNLVPGDIVEIEAGDSVSADSRIIWHTSNFSVQESSLTGESAPVAKTSYILEEDNVPLADRGNMLYMGTTVTSGKARAVVVDTGMLTELGKIAGMVQEIGREATPLQKKLEEFGKWIVYLCFVLVALVFILEWLRGGKLAEVFLTAVSLAVAAIPEGMPAVVTIALALGVQRMVKRNALIRKLPSVETLGCATVICSDKTGTLTKNEMTVQAIYAAGRLFKVNGIGYEPKGEILFNDNPLDPDKYAELKKALNCAVLCNDAELSDKNGVYSITGDPTEGSLLVAAAKAGMWKTDLEKEFPFIDEIPFDSERKQMTIIRQDRHQYIAFVKGAPDVMLDKCVHIEENNSPRHINAQDKENIIKINEQLAAQAMRVLAVAYRTIDVLPEKLDADQIEKDLIFVGLLAMIDPPRPEAKLAIEKCFAAGIKTVMITGDHKNTAVAIAKQLGFFKKDSLALTGEELGRLSDSELDNLVERIPVYARVSPEHKLRIVRAWRHRGEVVAMTGDGVNDAPAVKEADIGVAMGITGTDVTKEVSDMVVTDDNFASIVSAIEEGRGIYDNIKKFIHYLLSCNAGEIMTMFVASLVGFPTPLVAIQILWVNLITDGLPALALGVDTVAPDIMRRVPRKTSEPVITKKMASLILIQGSFIAFCSLAAFCFVYFLEKEGLDRARTAAFVVLSCSQLFHSFNCRNASLSIFKIGFLTNKKLILAVSVSFALQMAVVYIPFFNTVFKTQPLGILDWLMVLMISSLPLWAVEAAKKIWKE
ncbi:MAG: calcium-transporting P-type ATPase, PMR1-type [Candidatus Omnitrophota bacterium]